MARISRTDLYIYDGTVSDNDFVIGSDGDLLSKTKSYRMKDLRDYLLAGLSPITGGTLKYSEYTYNGVITSPAAFFNALNPVFVVMPYNVVILSMNGDRYMLKLQDVTVGFNQTPITDSDFILLRGDVSLGDGLDVLKGYNVANKKHEFYSLKSTSLNLSKETSSSVETGNILIEVKTDINLNIGVGSENVYKGYNSSNSKHEFKGIKDSLSIDVSSDSTDVSLEVKEIAQNLGTGVPVYTSFDTLTKKHKFRGLKSNTLNITSTTDDVNIEIPDFGANTIYVNNKYTGGSSNGSKTKPYTTVSAAVTGYIGTGTRLAPEKAGYVLYVERGNGTYSETNLDLTIKNLIFYLERDTLLNITNGTNWLVDLDAGAGATFGVNHSLNFYLYGEIYLYGNGFRSSGTNSTGSYTNTSTIFIKGDGSINLLLTPAEISSDGIVPTQRYTIISAGKVTPLNQNGQQVTFKIDNITLYSASQRIIDLGGQFIRLDYVDIVSAYDSDVSILDFKAILITGGQMLMNYGSIGGTGTVVRTAFINIEGNQTSVAHPYHQPILNIANVLTSGAYLNFISYKHNAIPSYDFSGKIEITGMTNAALLANSLMYNQTSTINSFNIKNCVLPGFTRLKNLSSTSDIKIYTTASNVIGAYIIDSLPEYGTYALALAVPLPVGARFVNTNSNSGDKNTWKIQTI